MIVTLLLSAAQSTSSYRKSLRDGYILGEEAVRPGGAEFTQFVGAVGVFFLGINSNNRFLSGFFFLVGVGGGGVGIAKVLNCNP